MFVESVFIESLYPHARKLAPFIRRIAPGYFDIDLEMIKRLADACSISELAQQTNSYAFFQRDDGYLRRVLCIRVSCRKLMQTAIEVMNPSSTQCLSVNLFDEIGHSVTMGSSTSVRVSPDNISLPEENFLGSTTITVGSKSPDDREGKGGNLLAVKNYSTTRHTFTFQESWHRIHGNSRDYVEGVFYRALYPHARWFARLMRYFYRNYFQADYEAIRWVSAAKTVHELRQELECYRHNHPERGVFRRALKLRISAKRLVNLGGCLLPRK